MATTAERKNSHKRNPKSVVKSKAIDRPFDPEVIARARAAVADYQMVIWREEGEWCAEGVEMPNAFAVGDTLVECEKEWREISVSLVAYAIEQGEAPPAPAREGLRTLQINVRLSPTEKLAIETRARQGGHDGISDYVRTVALAK